MNNITLHAIAAAIGDATHDVLIPVQAHAIATAAHHTSYRTLVTDARAANAVEELRLVPGDATTYFVKLADADHTAPLSAEAAGLAALQAAGAVRVPAVVVLADTPGESEGDDCGAALVLEWLDLQPLNANDARQLARQMAALHACTSPTYGWYRDNFIGANPQFNDATALWCDFFRDRRLQPQLQWAAKNRLPTRMIDRGERLLADIGVLLAGHQPRPALVHGDLWPGNVGVIVNGDERVPVVYDPACYYADHEVDIAMAQLFGGLPDDFFACYREVAVMPDGHKERARLYNLYHWLNHANIFAGGYVATATDAIERVLAEL
jgi:protein-ribulosamine 3-kinase